jgi:hypothetical protein
MAKFRKSQRGCFGHRTGQTLSALSATRIVCGADLAGVRTVKDDGL